MIIEEKAKTYDEALEKARKLLNMILDNELLGFPDQIREIFPQLTESEDSKNKHSNYMVSGVELIAKERERQINKEGFNWRHDDSHDCHQLSDAAIVYAAPAPLRYQVMNWWPWDKKWLKEDTSFTTAGRIKELTKAGALIAAEIDRLQRTIADAYENGKKDGEKQKESPKSADSIPADCVSDVKCEDRWHKVTDSLPDNPREVLCKDAIGYFFIGRYYKSTQSWEVVMYDDCDKDNEDNPPVVKWCEIPSEKQKEQPTDAKSERVIKAARRVLNNWLDGTDCPDVSGDFTELEHAICGFDGEEKQKDQKPNFDTHWENGSMVYEQKEQKPVKSIFPPGLGEAHFNPISVVEQKPHYCHHEVDETGWSEEYRKAYYDGWNNCNMQHEQCKAEQKPVVTHGESYHTDTIGTQQVIAGKMPQKPAEWSEEDEEKLNLVIDYLRFPGPLMKYKLKDWLKSLPERFNSKKCNKEMDLDTKLQDRIEEISRNGLENAHTIDFSKEYENSKQILEKNANRKEWSEEDEEYLDGIRATLLEIEDSATKIDGLTESQWVAIRAAHLLLGELKSIRPQPIQLKEAYKDGFQTARYVTALAFMNYLDENSPEGKMSLSNAECEDIDKAFKENDWAKILRYAENMEKRIELWVFPTGNVAVYRGSAFIPTEQLTKEERLFVLNRVYNELKGEDLDLDAEIKKYTENLYNETFGNGQGTLDEFDWEDIAAVIEDAARHFYNLRPSWKPSEEQMKILEKAVAFFKTEWTGTKIKEALNLESLYEQLKKL